MGPNDPECTKAVGILGAQYVLSDGRKSRTLGDKKVPEKFAGPKSKSPVLWTRKLPPSKSPSSQRRKVTLFSCQHFR
jgi:hypothetical protein